MKCYSRWFGKNNLKLTEWALDCDSFSCFNSITITNFIDGHDTEQVVLTLHQFRNLTSDKHTGWKLQNNPAFPSEKCRKDLPVRHYFCLSWTGKQTVIFTISAFPSEKCLKYLLVRPYFYLSRTGGQPVISIPDIEYQEICSISKRKQTRVFTLTSSIMWFTVY